MPVCAGRQGIRSPLGSLLGLASIAPYFGDVAGQVILQRELTVADPIISGAIQQNYEDINNGLQLLKIYLEPLARERP